MSVLERPVIILGAPRSGTTLLGKLLSAHPDFAYAVEPRMVWRTGNDKRSDLLQPQHARPEVIRAIHQRFESTVKAHSRSRLLEKTPSNTLRVPFIEQVFSDAKYVHILRDGYESVLAIRQFWATQARGLGVTKGRLRQRLGELSLRRLPYYAKEFARRSLPEPFARVFGQNVWGPRLPGIDQMVKDLSPLEVSALQWRWCVELGCQDGRRLPRDRYMELRLDRLDAESLGRVAAFIEVDDASPILDRYAKEFRPEQTRYRKAQADADDLRVLEKWIGPTCRWLEESHESLFGDAG
ncbi:MAG: sulfotransferase [Planctomycetota bacterium]